MKIDFCGHELVLHASGMAFWPAHKIGIVSDLHLEKGSHFAARGFFLPPYDSHDTLVRLLALCREQGVGQLIMMGDSFHDPKGYARMSQQDKGLLHQLRDFDPVWIMGNHDKDFVPEDFNACEAFELDGLRFRHQAQKGETAEISGHFHPKITLSGGRVQRPCFITDGQKLLLPAFGAYTGGLSVHSPEVRTLFPQGFEVYALGQERVYKIT